MGRKATYRIWGDASKEDICTTRFLKLLLKYNYVWRREDEKFKLNLTKEQAMDFLWEFNKSGEYLDELRASVSIMSVRHLYDEECYRLQNHSEGAGDPNLPRFSLADQLFRRNSLFTTVETPVSASLTNLPQPPDNERLSMSPKDNFQKQGSDSVKSLRRVVASPPPNISQTRKIFESAPCAFQSGTIPTTIFCLSPPIPGTIETANFNCTITEASKSPTGIGSKPENVGSDMLDANASLLADCTSTKAAFDSISFIDEFFTFD